MRICRLVTSASGRVTVVCDQEADIIAMAEFKAGFSGGGQTRIRLKRVYDLRERCNKDGALNGGAIIYDNDLEVAIAKAEAASNRSIQIPPMVKARDNDSQGRITAILLHRIINVGINVKVPRKLRIFVGTRQFGKTLNRTDSIVMDYFVHESAIVDEGAQVGAGTRIWHFCHLMPGAKVGKGCTIGQNVFIDNHVSIGNRVKIQNNVSLYNGVVVEDDVFLGPSMVLTNVINPRSFIERKTEFKPTLIRKGSTIGANATIICGVEIGEYALVGAGAVINKNVPAYALVVGNPGRQIGWVGRHGKSLVFDENGRVFSEEEGLCYQLENNAVRIIE